MTAEETARAPDEDDIDALRQELAIAHNILSAIGHAVRTAGHPDCAACSRLAPVLASYMEE